MRVSKEKAAHNREQILTAAARLFREQGIGATGVDSITDDAGLTHGAVYSQFGSKEAIAAEAVSLALSRSKHLWDRMAERKGKKKVFPAIVEQYLSAAHRDHAGQGCVIAAIGSEIARQPRSVRDSFTREFKHSLEYLAELMRENNSSRGTEDAIAAFVSMVGALIIARAVNDETLSDLILKSTAKRVVQRARVRRPARRRHSSMKA
ncbi:MAG TPA: TetR/AcrR family transcriptional regulator [Methylomirabilota bacterium]|nr:TetR/AcrR family transcriptional regulator [Methylomirabilota bacterium]